MRGFYKQVSKLLSKDGWEKIRQGSGSHQVWGKEGEKPITVSKNLYSRYLANEILKQAGINHKFCE